MHKLYKSLSNKYWYTDGWRKFNVEMAEISKGKVRVKYSGLFTISHFCNVFKLINVSSANAQ